MDFFGVGLGCSSAQSRRVTSALAGAVAAYTGADQLLVPMGFRPEVHWALAGVATDFFCRGSAVTIDPLIETGVAAVAGYAGAMVAKNLPVPKLF